MLQSLRGIADFILDRTFGKGFSLPFNGQDFRKRIFSELMTLPISAIIETGTFRGNTTKLMASATAAAVYTVEANPRYRAFARLNFRHRKNIVSSLGDSRSFLQRLGGDATVPKNDVFFYLDAHWYEDLPLRDELNIVAKHFTDAVIMVDDFEVPGDQGYGFDDYGPGKRLCVEYLGDYGKLGMTAFFPNAPASQETGFRRGCVVLASGKMVDRVRKLATLREFHPVEA